MLLPYMIKNVLEAGCDEAGRGPLAGNVFAAAVVWDMARCNEDDEPMLALLNDSKQLSDRQRRTLRPWIQQKAVAWAVAEATVEEIDQLNILNAAILAMHRALDRLKVTPQHIIVDGNRWKPYGLPAVPADTVVKGDGKYMSIAAASILAKTCRDSYMRRLHNEHPAYGWAYNKGYPTKAHYEAIYNFGITPYHRRSFKLEKNINSI